MRAPTPATPWAVELSLLIVRVVVGTIMFLHGAQKTFGWFEGPGLLKLGEMFAEMGVPKVIAYLTAIGECFGGAGIIVGFLCRFSAASNIVIMLGAIWTLHGANGFFADVGGFEYNLALIGLLIPPLLLGPGRISIGRFLPLPKAAGEDRPIAWLE